MFLKCGQCWTSQNPCVLATISEMFSLIIHHCTVGIIFLFRWIPDRFILAPFRNLGTRTGRFCSFCAYFILLSSSFCLWLVLSQSLANHVGLHNVFLTLLCSLEKHQQMSVAANIMRSSMVGIKLLFRDICLLVLCSTPNSN